MSLRVIGAGVGRTGTHSLKLALERLLGAPCYHMVELFQHRDHVASWHAATRGEPIDWRGLLRGYAAAVDWPASAFWRELSAGYPDAVVVLSVRDPQSWWRSADQTIFETFRRARPDRDDAWFQMVSELLHSRFTPNFLDQRAALEAYTRHVEEVKALVSPDRLVVWTPKDGWGPLCKALGLPVPEEPFPHVNTSEEFRARSGFDR